MEANFLTAEYCVLLRQGHVMLEEEEASLALFFSIDGGMP